MLGCVDEANDEHDGGAHCSQYVNATTESLTYYLQFGDSKNEA